ncbi:MAG: beta-ketoacyl synthase N-terminal-like domain-containing protein, partial [Deltaproteobacteria bacterium]|nr:beta-ketoacyl synthase N-terminal-like domain-containing protein [Deltaproteobacteria bacterium]
MSNESFVPPRGRGARTRELAGTAEPVAIVGMACRFPGAPDLSSFWRLLEAGGNSITENT